MIRTNPKFQEPRLYKIGQVVGYVDLIDAAEETAAQFPQSSTARWFCAVTNPNCQGRAARGLHQLGYRTFYPKVRRWVSHARVKVAKEKPLLGRYLFVEVDLPAFDDDGRKIYEPRQSFGEIRGVNGIEGMVSNPDPVAIPTAYVVRLRERYMAGEWDFVRRDQKRPVFGWDKDKKREVLVGLEENAPLPVGARVKIVEGEFEDLLATVTSRKGHRIDFKLHGENRYGRLNDCSVRAA